MRELNSATMNATAGALCKLPRPVTFPDGLGCSRIRAEATVSMKNGTGGAKDLTNLKLKDAVACLFATSTLAFGDTQAEVVDNALAYQRVREMVLILTGDDHSCEGTPVNKLADATVVNAGVAAGAAVDHVVEFVRPFEAVRLGDDAYRYCPGSTQMRQIRWEFVRGATFDSAGEFVQNGAASILFVADTFNANHDRWAAVPRLYLNEEAGRVSHGPAGECGMLAVWEYTSAGSASALSLFSIKRAGDAPLRDSVQRKRVVADAAYIDPVGMYDANGIVTVLHQLPASSELNEVPTGAGWAFEQTGSELAPPKTAWLHVPARTLDEVDAFVGANVAPTGAAKLVSAATKSRTQLSPHVAALEAAIIARPGSSEFSSSPGRVVGPGIAPTTHVPATVTAAARAKVAAHGTPADKRAVALSIAQGIAAAVPGGGTARRGLASGLATSIAGQLQ